MMRGSCICLLILLCERRGAQDHEPGQLRAEGADHHADLRFLDQFRRGRKCEGADEQAHREADAAEQGHAVDLG